MKINDVMRLLPARTASNWVESVLRDRSRRVMDLDGLVVRLSDIVERRDIFRRLEVQLPVRSFWAALRNVGLAPQYNIKFTEKFTFSKTFRIGARNIFVSDDIFLMHDRLSKSHTL
ncbi:hypothetical protein RvY_15999-1 [Ramazzottius varieornatus]|uniref:Uncharacterized protein n=1 Tax=Ramazzottius varieornatus TaxID=947166 RepID=A0A1D1W4R6_RAMVA|nr:hypothetical protein RvY_15999-1 [Ramazzottius varieornatus]